MKSPLVDKQQEVSGIIEHLNDDRGTLEIDYAMSQIRFRKYHLDIVLDERKWPQRGIIDIKKTKSVSGPALI